MTNSSNQELSLTPKKLSKVKAFDADSSFSIEGEESPWSWFNSIRFLNLDKDIDRKARFLAFCNRHRIHKVTKVASPVHAEYWKGAGRSHQLAVEQAKEAGFSNVLVMEDDCDFVSLSPTLVKGIVDYLDRNYWEYMAFSFTFIGSLENNGIDKNVDLNFLNFLRQLGAVRRLNEHLIEFNIPEHLKNKVLVDKHFLANSCCVAYNNSIFDKFIKEFDPATCQVMDQWSPKNFRCLVPSKPFVIQNTPDKTWHLNQLKKITKFFNRLD
jgi:hypothetical protein